MKMRKEAIILGVIIVALSLYLIFNKSDRSLYELPVLDPVEASDISKISLESSEGTLEFVQKAGEWVINAEAYPGDDNTIKRVRDTVANLTLATLISESENYERYNLDKENRITVKAWKGNQLIREFDVGKPGSNHRHTFVKLTGDHRVYHARESFRRQMEGEVDKFRDKSVLSFDQEKILAVQVSAGEEQGAFTKEATTPDTDQASTENTTLEIGQESKVIWKDMAGETVKENKLTKLLEEFSKLKCKSYIYDRKLEDFTEPLATITFVGEEESVLKIFERRKGVSQYPATSSQSEYPFIIPKWQADKVIKALKDIVPPEKETT